MDPAMRLALLVAGAAALAPARADAAARCELTGTPWLEGRVGEAKPAREVDARRGEAIAVELAAPGRLDGRTVVYSERPGPGRASWTASGCPPLEIRWRRIEPRMEHVETPPPNPGLAIYANAVVFGPRHGAWIGHDRIEYAEAPLPAGDDRWTLAVADATPGDAALAQGRPPAYAGLGTMRLAATLRPTDAAPRTTPGLSDRGQLADGGFRYSVRAGDGLVGWLTAWFNVPYVFGSAGRGARSQAERFVGTDCADLIVAAMRRAGRADLPYSSVGGLVRALDRVAGPIDVRARPDLSSGTSSPVPANMPAGTPLLKNAPEDMSDGTDRTGYAPRPGDVLALGYLGAAELPRAWDHIVVLVEDRGPDGPDGVLGPDDLVADIGDGQGVKFAPLARQGDVRAVVLRARGVVP